MTFKPEALNLAGTIALFPSDQKTETEISSAINTGDSLTQTATDAKTDLDSILMTGFMKYQIRPWIGFFSEVQTTRSDISMNTFSTSQTSMATDYFYMDQTQTTDSETDTKDRWVMVDTGFHIKPFSQLHWLTHFSRSGTEDDGKQNRLKHHNDNDHRRRGNPRINDRVPL